MKSSRRSVMGFSSLAMFAGACAPSSDVARIWAGTPAVATPFPIPRATDPVTRPLPPVRLPRDEGPHDVLGEWWYYTGHLFAPAAVLNGPIGDNTTGSVPSRREPQAEALADEVRERASEDYLRPGEREFGFEFVFFRGVRGDRPPGYAAHFAITDVDSGRFVYDERVEIALGETASPALVARPLPDTDPRPAPELLTERAISSLRFAPTDRASGVVSAGPEQGGFDLSMGGWRMRGAEGRDRLWAAGPGYRMDVSLQTDRPASLHEGEQPGTPGLISFGPAGYSYYYSRTRSQVTGSLGIGSVEVPVRGSAWMDHQWGDFLVLGGGGWDWFSAHLVDGRDLTISIVRNEGGEVVLAYGSLTLADGRTVHLERAAFAIRATEFWTSPHTAIRYPSGWLISIAAHGIDVELTPLVRDQELRTTASTGVTYWEGVVRLRESGTDRFAGRGYVELTGYK